MTDSRSAEVFVSYASCDRERVATLVGHLQSAGVSVWWDRDAVAGGRNYGPEIVRGIKTCKVLILVCTEASFRSKNIKQEIQLAWRYQRPYLPLLVDQLEHYSEQIEYWLEGWQWIEVLERPAEQWLPSVLEALAEAGVTCNRPLATASGPAVRPQVAAAGLDGLRALARFTDQIWPVPAEYARRTTASPLRDLGAPQDEALRRVHLGTRVCLAIESDRAGHVLLLDVGTSGKVYCLCPSRFATDTRITPGRTYLPPADSAHEVFVVTGEVGREHLIAIFSEAPLGLDWMPTAPRIPSRVLSPSDIDTLLACLRNLEADRWWALSTYFDVTP